MAYWKVVNERLGKRIRCDGPLTAQYERAKLEKRLKEKGEEPDVDVEIESPQRPLIRARSSASRKRSTKLTYK
jgi:hypothetical protein